MVVDEVLGMWWDDGSLKRGSSHVAIFVKALSTVISFNMADMIVFPGRLQWFEQRLLKAHSFH